MEANLINLKYQLNIEQEFTTDDIFLQNCLDTAIIVVDNYLDLPTGTTITANSAVNAAILLLAANYYNNRNMVSFGNASEMPYSFKFMLNPYKTITIS